MLMYGGDVSPAIDAVLTMWPSPCSSSRGVNDRMPWMTPHRFTPSTHSQLSTVVSQVRPPDETPALLQMTCAAPYASSAASRSLSTSAACDTSARTPVTSAPAGNDDIA